MFGGGGGGGGGLQVSRSLWFVGGSVRFLPSAIAPDLSPPPPPPLSAALL